MKAILRIMENLHHQLTFLITLLVIVSSNGHLDGAGGLGEFCSGVKDGNGAVQENFYCALNMYCCGSRSYKFCCSSKELRYSVRGTQVENAGDNSQQTALRVRYRMTPEEKAKLVIKGMRKVGLDEHRRLRRQSWSGWNTTPYNWNSWSWATTPYNWNSWSWATTPYNWNSWSRATTPYNWNSWSSSNWSSWSSWSSNTYSTLMAVYIAVPIVIIVVIVIIIVSIVCCIRRNRASAGAGRVVYAHASTASGPTVSYNQPYNGGSGAPVGGYPIGQQPPGSYPVASAPPGAYPSQPQPYAPAGAYPTMPHVAYPTQPGSGMMQPSNPMDNAPPPVATAACPPPSYSEVHSGNFNSVPS